MSYDVKYIGMDVHKEAIVIAVQNESGKLVMESVIETKASSILQFLHGLGGELHVTWEEGTWATWLYDLLQPQVQHIVVCNPRRNALLKEGSKSDKVDAGKLADLLRTGMLRPVYHGENGLRTLRELGRSYQTISKDLTRVMNRLKALYRGWGIPCAGTQVYAARAREEWLSKIPQAGVRRRAELLYQQLDGLQALRRNVRPEFLAESRKHKAAKLLRQIPYIGPVRAARLIGLMQTPHRFRSKRQLWTYSGLGIETHDSAQYRSIGAEQVRRLLASIDRHTAIGRRDYAIVLLLARLGLRSGEVAFLELEDINWDAGQVSVRGKRGHRTALPLPADVGAAIAGYLRHGRPRSTSRRVFLRSKAPIRGFLGQCGVGSIVRHVLQRAGIQAPTKGAHQFRHALATQMLRHGASLTEIGDALRHRSPQTTTIYAKVDLKALRTLALPWPGGVR